MAEAPLPIAEHLPGILQRVAAHGTLVLEAPPGAGKTTQVPAALLDAGLAGKGTVWVLQPRRLAARLAARRVAEERGERVGGRVGYQVRFEDVTGPETRLVFLTEGVFTRRLLANPTLRGVGCVVLDEFHERHIATDVALAQLRGLREHQRPDLRVVVMSATLDAEPVATYLHDGPRLRSPGRAFDVRIEHLERPDDRPLEKQVAGALSRLLHASPSGARLEGDVLVFLPGVAEIRRAATACRPLAERTGLLVRPLHGDLPLEDQDLAVRPASAPKLVLATNVAETSVTIDGVVAVIDSGLARTASVAPWSGLSVLSLEKVSRASAAQRAGRAGRTRPGVCLRLYTRVDHDTRVPFTPPEIRRLDLASLVLELRALGEDPTEFPFFEAPEPARLAAADELLARLGAVDARGEVTAVGRAMLRLPLHPRLARLVVHAEQRGIGAVGARAAAVLAERDLRLAARTPGLRPGTAAAHASHHDAGPSDVLALVDALEEGRRLRGAAARLRSAGIDPAAFRAADRAARQIERQLASWPAPRDGPARPAREVEAALAESVLVAFPDRVARRRTRGGADVLLAAGGAAKLAETSVVSDAELLVAVDAEARPRGAPLVRRASATSAEALLELFPDRVRDETEATWNAAAERVEVAHRVCYDALVLEERRGPARGEAEGTALLRERALAAGPGAFVEPEVLERLLARWNVVVQARDGADLPVLDDAEVGEELAALAEGRSSFAEMREAGLLEALLARLPPESHRLLQTLAPDRVSLGGERTFRVEYVRSRPPWIAAFIQDYFGRTDGPRVADGRVPVVMHLLAPSRRPVQVTTDLASFWSRHYPKLRRELSRRYPRHDWPEDPRTASPPARRRRRGAS